MLISPLLDFPSASDSGPLPCLQLPRIVQRKIENNCLKHKIITATIFIDSIVDRPTIEMLKTLN